MFSTVVLLWDSYRQGKEQLPASRKLREALLFSCMVDKENT